MRISDWSSDVCSSDLGFDSIANQAAKLRYMTAGQLKLPLVYLASTGAGRSSGAQPSDAPYPGVMNLDGIKVVIPSTPAEHPKSVVEGKSVSVSVDLGGRRIL